MYSNTLYAQNPASTCRTYSGAQVFQKRAPSCTSFVSIMQALPFCFLGELCPFFLRFRRPLRFCAMVLSTNCTGVEYQRTGVEYQRLVSVTALVLSTNAPRGTRAGGIYSLAERVLGVFTSNEPRTSRADKVFVVGTLGGGTFALFRSTIPRPLSHA